ncbi:MAG: flagellar biosynthetic protein FliR [Methylibium sp.]|nr:flagellar biosynthetic protein FliR [Methylibium sp.]
MVLPLLTRTIVPRQIRIAFMLILVLVAFPGLAVSFPKVDWNMWQWIAFVLKEMFIGGLIGYSMGMVLWALTAIGELMDVQAGYTNAQIFDPYGNHSAGPLSVLMSQLGVLLFVGFGGLQVFMQLLYESLLGGGGAAGCPGARRAAAHRAGYRADQPCRTAAQRVLLLDVHQGGRWFAGAGAADDPPGRCGAPAVQRLRRPAARSGPRVATTVTRRSCPTTAKKRPRNPLRTSCAKRASAARWPPAAT